MCNNLKIRCSDLKENEKIPINYTGYGKNISPEFIIENLTPEAKSYIITLEDLNHPIKNFTHWIIWNIPATANIPGNIPKGRKVSSLGNALQGFAYAFIDMPDPNHPKEKHINIVSQYMY